jgi:hypothetical protein
MKKDGILIVVVYVSFLFVVSGGIGTKLPGFGPQEATAQQTKAKIQVEEEEAPPSKQEKTKEGKWMEKGKENEGGEVGEEVNECKRSVEKRPYVKDVRGTGTGCSENQARDAARNNAAEVNCKNEKDPKCTNVGCEKSSGVCRVTAGDTSGDKKVCDKVTVPGCKQGWTCTVTGTYACDCTCR